MSTLDQLVDAARDGVRRRSSQITGEELRQRLGTRSGSRPFKEALIRVVEVHDAEDLERALRAGA